MTGDLGIFRLIDRFMHIGRCVTPGEKNRQYNRGKEDLHGYETPLCLQSSPLKTGRPLLRGPAH